ncbi:MAG TPA: GAF domain-containing protein, partial [Ktedonobacteraceae bacterium]|nr:GAF domain-containing protein [Ktedonobacteraceae bacterium]
MKDQPLPLRRASQLLDRLEQTLGKPGDLQSTLQHILQTAQNSFESDGCMLVTINPITGLFMDALTIVDTGLAQEIQLPQPRPQEVTQEILRQGLLLIENLEYSPDYHTHFTRDEGFQSFVGLALREKYSQKALGALYLNFHQPQHFSAMDRELLQFFAEQTSYILQETWLVQRHQEVARIGQEINQELSTVDALFQKLQEHVNSILDTSYIFQLAVCRPQTNTLDIYLREQGQLLLSRAQPMRAIDREIIEAGNTIFVPDLSTETWQLPFQSTSTAQRKPRGSLIFVPLTLRGSMLGALSIRHPQAHIYNQEDQFILELLANQIALALHNIRLYDNLTMLNEVGQVLTQYLESEQVLQVIVDQICEATKADSVILYPYESTQKHFTLPPRVGGTLLDATPLYTKSLRPYDIAVKALEYDQPIFASEHSIIYTTLRGNVHLEETNFQQREKLSSAAVLPLKTNEVAVGVLFINYRLPQDFDPPQQSLIEGLAHYAAIALKNAQAYYTVMQRRIRELEILQEIDRELSQPIQLDEVLETILRLGHEHVPAEEASLLLYDPHTRILEPRAFISRHQGGSLAKPISLDDAKGITAWAVAHKISVLVNNVHKAPWNDRYIQASLDIVSELDVPMFYEGEVVGVLNFESTREGAFGYDEELFLTSLAGQAVLAINKSQAYEREKRLAEERKVLNEIGREITSQLDRDYVFKLILDKALELTGTSTGTLMLYEKNLLWMAAERGVTEDNKHQIHDLNQGVVGYVARHKEPINIDPSQPPWSEIFLHFIPGSRSELTVPMLVGDELLGVLNVESGKPNHFHDNDERLLMALADLACIALQNARAYLSEKRLADESQVLYEISREISSQFDSENIFKLILQKALNLTNAFTGSLYLYDPDLQDLQRVAEYDMQRATKEGEKHQKLNEGIIGYVAT